MELQKILVPTDFSSHAQKAMEWAAFLASKHDAKLVLLHVIPPVAAMWAPELGAERTMEKELADLFKRTEEHLQDAASKLRGPGREVLPLVVRGQPFREICEVAKGHAVDLIVMGTHGRTGLEHLWLGSVAERVVRQAPCAVLTTRKSD